MEKHKYEVTESDWRGKGAKVEKETPWEARIEAEVALAILRRRKVPGAHATND